MFMDLMQKGGPVMWVILACSVAATVVFLEKVFHFHRIQVNVGDLVRGLVNVLKRDNLVEAVSLCDDTPGPAAHVLRAAILAYEQGGIDLEKAVEDAEISEIPRLESRLSLLATIAYIAPLLGLLGTVLGMIGVFSKISEKGAFVNATDLADNIGMALYTTAAGLCVAIPCYVAYNYLVARIESIVLDMEKASSEILGYFRNRHAPKASTPATHSAAP